MNVNSYVSSSYFHPLMSFTGQETFPRIESSGFHTFNRHQNPRKKRTKFIKVDNSLGGSSSTGVTKPKCLKKPDPSAPKITRPCSECGKKFWSWKALFGHMRCHPERQWRGINPPPNIRRLETTATAVSTDREGTASGVTEEDHEVATCLLMLANGCSASASESPSVTNVCSTGMLESDSGGGGGVVGVENFRFECSSCKKVFGSHQALGGHRASHKNVKGCYAINKNPEIGEEEEQERDWINSGGHVEHQLMDDIGHKCSICLRVFSTGQALGGHKRCHWEKVSEEAWFKEANSGLDLNLPASAPAPARDRVPVHEDDLSSSASFYFSGLELDLRLGL
ncbi:zinc finger protein ZAT3-like [Olea europaea var. sylvestris]|uniref:Zinc finger ZAT3-like n=1 Tax=Olea europaea subsp. europaea TaxID=158383 RepID=A0A8S0RFW4_OLEEU|nr:zinc finger protein ZAT3-like [Olea europaea var. sylvestris]CAA2978479.1 zinc finger ZAT3-like [Olea europaea subsp. europaea]